MHSFKLTPCELALALATTLSSFSSWGEPLQLPEAQKQIADPPTQQSEKPKGKDGPKMKSIEEAWGPLVKEPPKGAAGRWLRKQN